MDLNPEVSIILATYNRAQLISSSIDSVLSQKFTEWELIVVDDGSEDNTSKIVDRFRRKDQRIKYYCHTHKNLPLTRNAGIKLSCGEYITFIDSDDTYDSDHLLLRVKTMKQNPDIDLLHGGYKVIGSPLVVDKNDHTRLIHLDDCYIGGTFFGKRKVFTELNGFRNLPYSEDSDFMERALVKFNVLKVNYPTYIYNREIKDSISNTIADK